MRTTQFGQRKKANNVSTRSDHVLSHQRFDNDDFCARKNVHGEKQNIDVLKNGQDKVLPSSSSSVAKVNWNKVSTKWQ